MDLTMAAPGLLRKFPVSVKGGIDLPPHFPSGAFKQRGQINHFDRTDDQQINVAARGLVPLAIDP